MSTLYNSCFHLSALGFFLPKMNFSSSQLHIVVEPATDCSRYVGVVDIIEQLLMVLIVECSCQIERDEHCSMSRLISWEAGSNVGGDRRQCSACRVFRPKATLSRLEKDVCQYSWQHEFFQRFGRWAQETNGTLVLAHVDVLDEFCDRDDYRFVPYFGYLSSLEWQIEDVGEIVDGTMSKLLEVEVAHPVWPDGYGQFGQSDRFFCVGKRERQSSC